MHNPYRPGALPEHLLGRDIELAQITRRVETVLATGGGAGAPLVFTAPRGLGKTSLLRRAAEDAYAQGFAVAWLSCVRDTPMLPDLASAVAQALRAVDADPRGERPVRLKQLQVEIGLPGVKTSTTIEPRATDRPGEGAVAAVAGLLRDAARTLRDRGGAGLALFVDELHAPPAADIAILWNALQNLAGESTPPNPILVVGAGLPSTPGHITRAATFGERSDFRGLPRLGEADTAAALLQPAADLGVPWNHDALRLAAEESGHYPYLIQLIGSVTWDAADPTPGQALTVDDVRAGLPAAQAQLDAMVTARWEAATEAERDFLAAMAASAGDVVPRREIAARLGVVTHTLSAVRERLIEKGLVEPVGRGTLRFTLPGFGDFVRDERDLPREES